MPVQLIAFSSATIGPETCQGNTVRSIQSADPLVWKTDLERWANRPKSGSVSVFSPKRTDNVDKCVNFGNGDHNTVLNNRSRPQTTGKMVRVDITDICTGCPLKI